MTPADELRTAAEELRRLARAALGNGRPWRYAKGLPDDSVRTETGWEVAHGDDPNNLRYIAAMSPNVGLALADWLDQAAHYYECGVQAADDVFRDDPAGREAFLTTGPGAPSAHALAVARAITGSSGG